MPLFLRELYVARRSGVLRHGRACAYAYVCIRRRRSLRRASGAAAPAERSQRSIESEEQQSSRRDRRSDREAPWKVSEHGRVASGRHGEREKSAIELEQLGRFSVDGQSPPRPARDGRSHEGGRRGVDVEDHPLGFICSDRNRRGASRSASRGSGEGGQGQYKTKPFRNDVRHHDKPHKGDGWTRAGGPLGARCGRDFDVSHRRARLPSASRQLAVARPDSRPRLRSPGNRCLAAGWATDQTADCR